MEGKKNPERAAEIRAWLRENGIRPVDRLDLAIEKEFGKDEGGRIIDEMNRLFDLRDRRVVEEGLSDRHALRDTAMVELINQSRRLSMLVAGFYDWFVYRQVLEYLCDLPDCFAGEVLDLGCGNGVITNFLARRYPEARFTGADISPRALEVAQEGAQERGLTNIRYLQQKAPEAEVDTLLSVRALHENLPAPEQDAVWIEAVRDYIPRWTACVRPGGHLVIFDRAPMKSAWAAIEEALDNCGFILRPEAQAWISCRAGDDTGRFRFAVYDRRK